MNMEKSCQQKNSDSSKKFVRKPLIAIRRGPVLYTPKNTLSRGSRRRSLHHDKRSGLRGCASGAPPSRSAAVGEFPVTAGFLAEDFLAATLATFARSLPVPLAAIRTSLHRPL